MEIPGPEGGVREGRVHDGGGHDRGGTDRGETDRGETDGGETDGGGTYRGETEGRGSDGGESEVLDQRRDQILKLVTKGFFNELVNYGVVREEMIRVASHLLDHVLKQHEGSKAGRAASPAPLTVASVVDRWKTERWLAVDQVILRPLERASLPQVVKWLRQPAVNESFATPFPEKKGELERYLLEGSGREYLAIHGADGPVGIIGGENLDRASGKVEMRKLVGDPALRGQGIGKRATFAFLYYAFMVLDLHKVYIHSRDINVRNINVNSASGFEVEGVFLEDVATADGRRADLIRMALLRPRWLAAFGGTAPGGAAPPLAER
jgi:RimJ/RimL family protein N-acetyltransferase